MTNLPVDKDGRSVSVGSRVRILSLSGGWFEQLPPDELADVESMIGQVFTVDEIDEYGQPWVNKGWHDASGYRSHSIALEPQEMVIVDKTPHAE